MSSYFPIEEPEKTALDHRKIPYPFRYRVSPKGYQYYKRRHLIYGGQTDLVSSFYRMAGVVW